MSIAYRLGYLTVGFLLALFLHTNFEVRYREIVDVVRCVGITLQLRSAFAQRETSRDDVRKIVSVGKPKPRSRLLS